MAEEDDSRNYFRKEIQSLSTILVFFSVSYLLRVILELFLGYADTYENYTDYVILVCSTVPLDLLPISIVLFYHRKNLSRLKDGQKDKVEYEDFDGSSFD